MVVKPASQTPLTALALAELAQRAGVPSGAFSVLTGNDTRIIGAELMTKMIAHIEKHAPSGSDLKSWRY